MTLTGAIMGDALPFMLFDMLIEAAAKAARKMVSAVHASSGRFSAS